MNRTINILVDGSHLTKDRGTAGVQHEGNSTVLRITFDESWDNLAKSVTWWNAKGLNPVVRVLTVDMLEDIKTSTRVYRCPIPAEPLTEAGMCTFVIDGFLDGKRQRSISDQLKVTAAPYAANAGAAADPTPTQAEQLQSQIEAVVASIRKAVEAAGAADTAFAAAQAAQLVAYAATAAAEEAMQAAKAAQSTLVSKHAERHAATGDDIITPEMLGAATKEEVQAAISSAAGKVSKSGDTINGNLTIDGALTVKRSDSDRIARTVVHNNAAKEVDFQNYGSDSNYIALRMATEATGVGDAAKVVQMLNGSFAAFTLLHTGNKEKIFTFGAADLTAGSSPLGTGQLYFVYE